MSNEQKIQDSKLKIPAALMSGISAALQQAWGNALAVHFQIPNF
jgi:hypothetical protein